MEILVAGLKGGEGFEIRGELGEGGGHKGNERRLFCHPANEVWRENSRVIYIQLTVYI